MTDWNTFAAAEQSGDRERICQLLEKGLTGEPLWKTHFYRAKYAWGTSFIDKGLDSYEELSRMDGPEWWHRADAREALKLYKLPRLPMVREDRFPIHPEGHKDSEILVPMNPSLVVHQGQLWVNLRMVDWFLDIASGSYGTRDAQGRYRTKNLLGPYPTGVKSKVLDTSGLTWMKFDHPPKIRQHHVHGFEDCRFFSWPASLSPNGKTQTGRLGFIGLSTRTHPEHSHKLSLGWVEGNTMTDIVPLRLSDSAQTQKNWLPFVYQGEIHLICRCSPFQVLKYDRQAKKVEKVLEYQTFPGWTDFCGGAPPIPFEIDDTAGWLMVIHTLSYRNGNTGLRTYWHRFVWLNEKLKPTLVSDEFRLACNDIEYILGMAQDPKTGLVGLGYGYRDRQARVRWLKPEMIQEMLYEV